MSVLGELIFSSGRFFDQLIADFETATRNQAKDVDLIGEILTKSNLKLRQLKLTPGDSLSKEVYYAALGRFALDAERVDYQVVGDSLDYQFFNAQIIRTLNRAVGQKCFCINELDLFKILKFSPPINLIKKLKLKNEDELLKLFSVREIVPLARSLESKKWCDGFIEAVADLPLSAYGLEKINFYPISLRLRGLYRKQFGGKRFVLSALAGGVLFLESTLADRRIGALTVLIDGLNEARSLIDVSNQIQIHSLSKQFNQHIRMLLKDQALHIWTFKGSPLPWRSVYRALANPTTKVNKLLKAQYPELRLARLSVAQKLYDSFDDLDFWLENDYLAVKNQREVVSLNISDLNANYQSPNAFKIGQASFLSECLWDELMARYLSDPNLAEQIMLQLKSGIIKFK